MRWQNVANDSADVFREVIPCLRSGDRKSLDTNSRQSAADWCRQNAVIIDTRERPRYPGTSPWTILHVKTVILNSIFSGTCSQWRQASMQRCGRMVRGDRATVQPCVHHWLWVVGPNRLGGQAGHCCHSPNELAQGWPPVSGTCRSTLSDGSGTTGEGWWNTEKPFVVHGSAEILSGPHRLNQSAVNWQSWTRKLVLSSTCRTPYNFRFVTVQWQPVRLHPAADSADTFGDLLQFSSNDAIKVVLL